MLPFWRTAGAAVFIAAASFATASADPAAASSHTGAIRLATAQTLAAPQLRLTPAVDAELGDLLSAKDATSAADMKMWLGEPRKDARAVSIRRFARGIVNRTSSIAASLTRNAMRFIGTPYVFGGTSPSGFDCSGYTQHIFAMHFFEAHRLVRLHLRLKFAGLDGDRYVIEEEKTRYLFHCCTHCSNSTRTWPA